MCFCHQCGNFIAPFSLADKISIEIVQDGKSFCSIECCASYETENPYVDTLIKVITC